MVKLVDWKEENKDREGEQVKWRGREVEDEETEKRRKSGQKEKQGEEGKEEIKVQA